MNFPDRPQIFPVPIQKFPVLPFRELALEARGIPGMLASRIELDRRQNREIPCIFPSNREKLPPLETGSLETASSATLHDRPHWSLVDGRAMKTAHRFKN